MGLGTWIGRLLLSTFFVAGYVTYYGSKYYSRLRESQAQGPRYILQRLAMLLVPLVLAIGLQLIANTTAVGQNLYLNLQLFVIVYPLISDDLALWEYSLRWLMMLPFWYFNHPFDLRFCLFVTLCFGGLFFLVRRWQRTIHYQTAANFAYALVISALYWGTYKGLASTDLIAYPVFFLAMNYYSFRYWSGVHAEKAERERLTEEVNHDALTGARSLISLRRDGAADLRHAQETSGRFALAVLDVDHFKSFNDDFGHAAGDAVLVGVTKLLQSVIAASGSGARLYRTGGEEMTVLLPGYSNVAALQLAKDCWEKVRSSRILFEQESLRCTISLGLTYLRPQDGRLNDLAGRADSSLYQSKQRGRDCVTVDGQTETVSELRTTLMNYTFFTQPLVRVRNNQVLSSELLLRVYDEGEWHLPEHFDVTVPTMMNLIERAIHNMAVKSLCMNYELAELANPAIQKGLRRFATRHPELQSLVIELSTMPDVEQLRRCAPVYRDFGVHFAIDSAGMPGVAAQFAPVLDLISLVKIPLQQLRSATSESEIRAVIARWQKLCQARGIYLLLEGIESAQDIVLAHEMGIEYGQGYYFSRPVLPRIV